MKSLDDIITIDKQIQGGKPVFKGTRVTIETLFDYLEHSSLGDFIEGFPSVNPKHIEFLLEWIKRKTTEVLLDENIA